MRPMDQQGSKLLLTLRMQLSSKNATAWSLAFADGWLSIVFVHGLTGNREKTWTHRNGIFWPDALLSENFPRARIMTFGYDADVVRFWTIASSNRLDDHGKSLAYALSTSEDKSASDRSYSSLTALVDWCVRKL